MFHGPMLGAVSVDPTSEFRIVFVLILVMAKSKSKAVPVLLFLTENHAMKAYWGSGCTATRILDLGTRWR
jgi:hypothetical protein